MTADDYIKSKLASFAWKEAAQYGGTQNMTAVALVIRNRVYAGWCGGDWLDVLANAPVSSALNPRHELIEPQPDFREPAMRRFLQAMDSIYDGSLPDTLTVNPKKEGALYYAELDKIERDWFLENICRKPENHPITSKVGPVTFFR